MSLQLTVWTGSLSVVEGAMDVTGINNQPKRENNVYAFIYFVFFIIFGIFFASSLLVRPFIVASKI